MQKDNSPLKSLAPFSPIKSISELQRDSFRLPRSIESSKVHAPALSPRLGDATSPPSYQVHSPCIPTQRDKMTANQIEEDLKDVKLQKGIPWMVIILKMSS
ncbi:Hypothetical protein FKW44_016573 [Caligus rogercresseyi]|uniref:Uncharacterized protein n=1 Tax=Caligus rogercresseyi TaxID=217165 RepID=A0A7T8H240_CALRO|nr:Hypothetical protein FKW44_016573 [Caligus rogercresseyi]